MVIYRIYFAVKEDWINLFAKQMKTKTEFNNLLLRNFRYKQTTIDKGKYLLYHW